MHWSNNNADEMSVDTRTRELNERMCICLCARFECLGFLGEKIKSNTRNQENKAKQKKKV
jgi:hypothetical protein